MVQRSDRLGLESRRIPAYTGVTTEPRGYRETLSCLHMTTPEPILAQVMDEALRCERVEDSEFVYG